MPECLTSLRALLLSFLLFFVPSLWAQSVTDLRWISEQYAPYNYLDDDGQPQGMSVDVLKAIWERLGIAEEQRKIEFLPWARGYALTRNQPGTVLFSTTYTPARLKIFSFVGPIVPNRIVILSRKVDKIRITEDLDLQKLKIGVVREDIGEQLIIDRGVGRESIVASNLAASLVKLLDRGRVDAIAYGYDIAVWNMLRAGIDPDQYEVVYLLLDGELGFAFHPETDPAVLQQLQAVVDELRRDGTISEIRQRYVDDES